MSVQCMPYSAKFSMTLQTEILNRNFRFLKEKIILKSFNSVLKMKILNSTRKEIISQLTKT